jgi:NADH dehydrogenase [ubiquinone] 1 alpha subcomplex assembly factor 1
MTLLSFNSSSDMKQYALGCDSDIGGTSTAQLDFVPDEGSSSPDAKGKGRFWGEMRLGVRSDLQGRVRGGYAGFRSKVRRE